MLVMGWKSGGKLLNWGREPSELAGFVLGERLEIRRGSSAGEGVLGTGAGVVGIAVVVAIVVVVGIVVVLGLAVVVVGLVVVMTTCGGGAT